MSLSTAARAFICVIAAFPLFAADATLLSLVPADAKTVAGIDVSQTTASPFGQFLLSKMQNDDQSFRDFVAATGFDPRRDLREVIVASNSIQPGSHDNGLVMARGTFDVPKILAAAGQHGATTLKINGADVIQGRAHNSEDHPGWVALLDSSTAIAGPQAMVEAALARRGMSPQFDAKLASGINDYSSGYNAWVASTAPVGNFAANVPDKQVSGAMKGGLAQSIDQVNGGLRFGSTIEMAGQAVTRSDKDAQSLLDVVKFLVGMVQMNTQNQPDAAKFAKLIENLDVKTAGTSLLVSLSIPETDLEQLINQAPKAQKTPARHSDRGETPRRDPR